MTQVQLMHDNEIAGPIFIQLPNIVIQAVYFHREREREREIFLDVYEHIAGVALVTAE